MSSGHESGPAVNMPYFFLSYARTPKRDENDKTDPDRWVYKLYRDLCDTILTLINVEPESAGFMDRENRTGDKWPDVLTQALANCRVFVPLYSERYFESENCGKEWFAFSRRELNHRTDGTQAASGAIIPVLWTTIDPDSLPDVAKSIHYDHHSLGARYSAEGFFGIIKLHRYRDDYQLAVLRLARRIVAVARETKISSEPPTDYHSLPSAFPVNELTGASADRIQIMILALDTTTLPEDRTSDYYGNTPDAWRPYFRPNYSQPLAGYAEQISKCFGCEPVIGIFDEHGPGWGENGRPVPPGLCLVDAWTTSSPLHQEWLRRLDELQQPWVSVLVPWNSDDRDMAAAEQALRAGLTQSLGRKLASVPYRCRSAATGIPTLREFGELLPQMAMIMQKRFRKSKDVPTYPPEGPPTERPRIRRADPESPGGTR